MYLANTQPTPTPLSFFSQGAVDRNHCSHLDLQPYNFESKMPFSFFKSVKAQDDDELVDPQVTLREKCSAEDHCSGLKTRLDECNARVLSKKHTTEQCTEELFDFLHCVDHCVSKTLFSHLK
ncbi:hypothetical protein LSTR_LSTR005618 [Laodelphax striatellus]|uniref:Ubiquinol-cytochrome C reductase hinge domain-containing protein n=1 Tax=Laodelphax striatellus TaxID=195883 RepID=A0A482WVE9_LAOST|nr:hypothetical protein LSTR_LSTR005618 [Laodelphax striatellus]